MKSHHSDDGNIFSSPRCAELQKLTHEHETCIRFADELARIAAEGDDAALNEGIERVREYNDREMETHLQHEEQTILGPLLQRHPEHRDLCIALGQEHGLLRTLVESMTPKTAKEDLAQFAEVLKQHTLTEGERLFPLVEQLFSADELNAVMAHVPLHRQAPPPSTSTPGHAPAHSDRWLDRVTKHFEAQGLQGGHIVLFPRFQPEHVATMTERLDLALFDFQRAFMSDLGEDADRIGLEQLSSVLQTLSEKGGVVVHQVEALLCVKSEEERRRWLAGFLAGDWPNPVVLPITLYQAEVPETHPHVCDLELEKMPQAARPTPEMDAGPLRYPTPTSPRER